MEFRPLIIDNESRGFNQYAGQKPAQEQDLLRQLEHGASPEENIPGVDCTLKLGFPDVESTPSTLQTPPESQQALSMIRSTPQQLQQVRSNNNVMLPGGAVAAMNIPPPLMSWPPAPHHPNFIPRYGAGVPLYPSPPLVAAPALEPSRSNNNVVYPINFNSSPLPPLAISQRYAAGPVLRSTGSEETNHQPIIRKCMACKTTSTPLWRNGPRGPKSLCNACGIRFKKEERKAMGIEPQSRQKGSTSRNAEGSSRST